ncbi:MAG: hypothetical protein RLZZ373_3745 [Pseudomonadota bacterium]
MAVRRVVGMSPKISTVREWLQTIVLAASVLVSCVVVVYKVGAYTNELVTAVSDATTAATKAVAENIEQQKQIDRLADAERVRAERERAVAERIEHARRGRMFDK